MMNRILTLSELLENKSSIDSGKGYYYINKKVEDVDFLSFKDLFEKSKKIAAILQNKVSKNDRVLLLYPQSLDYISAFFGCIFAGAIAVPAYPPRNNRNTKRLESIIKNSSSKIALTNKRLIENTTNLIQENSLSEKIEIISTDEIEDDQFEWIDHKISEEDIAFLQYTSGSTKAPRGVMVTHKNLLHNSELLKKAFGYDDQSHCVSWLPMYHDMGLIGGILQPLYGGYSCTIMSPTSFLQSPFRWLKAISKKKGTISGAPNFGYELCVKKITNSEANEIDLSSWKIAFNGAEAVSSETMESFSKKFSVSGFESKSFFPCYGLAEATLFVSGGPSGSGVTAIDLDNNSFGSNKIVELNETENSAENKKIITSSGKIHFNALEVTIVDEDGRELPENSVGEIWISGQSITKGYWENSEETEKVFKKITDGNKQRRLLATGDLGFIKSGKLYVTGRIKDLIIIRGVNHYPQDIEKTVISTNSNLNPQGCAAFSIEKVNEEVLAIVLEIRHPQKLNIITLINNIRNRITEIHGIDLNEIIITKASKIPKTTSGKIQRYKCKQKFLNSNFPIVKIWSLDSSINDKTNNNDTETVLKNFIAILENYKDGISPTKKEIEDLKHSRLSDFDSLKITELTHIIEKTLDKEITFSEISKSENFAELFDKISKKPKAENSSSIFSIKRKKYSLNENSELSFGQKGFWFTHQLYDQFSPDNLFIAIKINHKIDVEILHQSVNAILKKYKILRTGFIRKNDDVVSFVNSLERNYFDVIDVSNLNETDLKELISIQVSHPFDIEQKLSAFKLYRRGESEFVLLFKIHHSIADYWSLKIIAGDLIDFYNSLLRKDKIDTNYTNYTYNDFIIWQNSYIKSERGSESLKFWKKRLKKQLPIFSLPISKQKLEKNKFKGDKYTFRLNKDLLKKIKNHSSDTNVSLYTTLFSTYFILLYRYTNQNEQVVGSPFSGRTSAKWSDTVGYFVNPLPIRFSVTSSDNFLTVQNRLRKELLKVSNHQDYPFNLLVEKIKPSRVAKKNPVFQTMFVFQNEHHINGDSLASFSLGESNGEVTQGDLKFQGFEIDNKSSQFELSVFLAENTDCLLGKIEFNTAIFDKELIEHFVTTWQTLIKNLIDEPERSINLVEAVDPNGLIPAIDQKQPKYETHSNKVMLHHLFEEQVSKTPGNIAVEFGETKLSFFELNKKAEELALELNQRGIGNEDLVGICLPRTEKLLVSIIAVLKSGAAYVPLDLNYPANRLSYISKDSKIKLIIKESHQKTDWIDESIEEFNIDELKKNSYQLSSKEREIIFDNNKKLAYVIYTSGSTGKPKGVAIEHRNVVSFINWSLSQFSEKDLKRTLASTSINFDLSIFEMFAPICCGGRVLMVENALFLEEIAQKSKITMINTVPSVIAELIRLDNIPKGISNINLAGEPLNPSLVKTLYHNYSANAVFNLYGPSEDTTYSTFELTEAGGNKVTIGKSIAETDVYILNESLQKVPDGAIGEIFISGKGLARGYFQKSDLTAENFLPDPFSTLGGSRMYRTGDLAQLLPSGKISYLGRLDNQVKVRGFRIELGEIETNLRSHSKIAEAIAITKEAENEDLHLYCFYTTVNPSEELNAIELRSFLKKKLPDYMIPQQFKMLDSFPLTPNNKINRLALKKYKIDFENEERAGTLPIDTSQKEIAKIWKEILNKENIYLEDNFFELGGTSLQITQVLSRIKENFEIKISLQEIYDCFTVQEQAELINCLKNKSDSTSNQQSKIKPVSRSDRRAIITNK